MKAIQYIRLIGKEFISLTDAELHLWVEMVRPMVSRKQFGKLYEQAIAYLVCHKLKMAGYGENPLGYGRYRHRFRCWKRVRGREQHQLRGESEFQPRNGCRTRFDRLRRSISPTPTDGYCPNPLQR